MTSTALLVMDVQQGVVDRFAGDDGYLPRLTTAVHAARAAGPEVVSIADWVAGLDRARPAAG